MLPESPTQWRKPSRPIPRSVAMGIPCSVIAVVGILLLTLLPWVTLRVEDPWGVQSASYGASYDKTAGSEALPDRLTSYSSISFDGGQLVPRFSLLTMSSFLALVGISILSIIAVILGLLPLGRDRTMDEAVRATPFLFLAILAVLPIHTGLTFLGHAVYRLHLDTTLDSGGEALAESLTFPAAYLALGLGATLLILALAEVQLAYRDVRRATSGGA